MDARHGGGEVGRNMFGQQVGQNSVGLSFRAGGVEKRCGKDVETLNICCLRILLRKLGRGAGRLFIVDAPGRGIQEARQTGIRDAPLEESIGRQGAKDVVRDLFIGRTPASVDEAEVGVGRERPNVQKGQPKIYAIIRHAFFCCRNATGQDRMAEEGQGARWSCSWRRPISQSHFETGFPSVCRDVVRGWIGSHRLAVARGLR